MDQPHVSAPNGHAGSERQGVGMGATENKARMREFWERGWNGGDISAVDDFYAPAYFRNSVDPETRDREYLKENILSLRTAFPDFHSTIVDFVAEDDRLVTRWTAEGTHRGVFLGFPPTGTPITTSGVVISRFSDGLVVEDWATWNALDVLRDLGVIHII
jgi:steroid delta-isomerase-like uncharacterized protein